MYKEYLNEIVSVSSFAGEIVGRLVNETDTTITLENPRLFVMGEQGTGFAMGISMTCASNPKKAVLQLSSILTLLPSNNEVAKGWIEQTSSIVIPK